MTPTTNPERFNDREREFFDRGTCCWQTSYGTIVGIVLCGTPRIDGFHLCRHHAREFAGDRPSSAQLRVLEATVRDGDARGNYWRVVQAMCRREWLSGNSAHYVGEYRLTDKGEAALYFGRAIKGRT